MAVLELDPDPDDEFQRLRSDDWHLARAVDEVFVDLETEPHKAYLTRTYLRPRGLYKVLVQTAAGYPDHMILWEFDGDIVVIRYLGANFANA
ncbi:hypothetical protein [Arthrobacter sp. TMS1-12-1]